MGARGVLLRLGFAALAAAVVAAVPLQERALSLGLFNEGRGAHAVLSWTAAALAAAALAVFAAELAGRRPLRLAGALRGVLAAALLTELLLFALDAGLVSRGFARLGGPYREVRGPEGLWVTLKKPHRASPFGFRAAAPVARRSARARLLFVGDSYTEGSGRAAACNYPEVAAATLAERLGAPVDALNAGVAGAGPEGARRVLALLLAEGFEADAVVYSLFLENDFTDDLPGTERRVVAGLNDRMPESWFLRAFHPLNTRAFRFGLFVRRTSRFVRGGPDAVRREEGACRLEALPAGEPDPELRRLVLRRLESNYGPQPRLAAGEVERAVRGMQALAAARGLPFVLVVFPDRVLADADLRARLGLDAEAFDLGRLQRLVAERFADLAPLDATPALAGAGSYRASDTHLSDLGNVRAGRFVGERLAERLPPGFAEPRRGSDS